MPITTWLDGYKPDPETRRVIGVAFERNPDLLCERALKDLRESPPRA
jgi:hypothetical protein